MFSKQLTEKANETEIYRATEYLYVGLLMNFIVYILTQSLVDKSHTIASNNSQQKYIMYIGITVITFIMRYAFIMFHIHFHKILDLI